MTANTLRTFVLLAALSALFMGVEYLIGGPGGAMIALVLAGAMNLFAYWNADKMVLRMHGAREIIDYLHLKVSVSFTSSTLQQFHQAKLLQPDHQGLWYQG